MKVFFHVQHLLGIGHLRRAATLAGGLADAGCDVLLASGGTPVPGMVPRGVRVLQLPPATAEDASFKHLLDEGGRRVDDSWKARRSAILLESFHSERPDVLLVELFPFGRRQMAFELIPLLEAARAAQPRPLVACSVRDMIQSKPGREVAVLGTVERYFDRVLVHGDPRVAPFGRSFAAAAALGAKLAYTGYVVEPLVRQGDAGSGEVLVSAGGGAVGGKLLQAALEARPFSSLGERTWRLLTGVNGPALAARGDNVIVERQRGDFTTLLANCAVSISQAGYNTVMETVQARARAVLVPFAAEGESEQTLRAGLLAERGGFEVLAEAGLTPAALACAVDRAAAKPRPAPGAIDLDGARRTAELLRGSRDG